MLSDFQHDVHGDAGRLAVVLHDHGVVDRRQVAARELDVEHGPDDSDDVADVLFSLAGLVGLFSLLSLF